MSAFNINGPFIYIAIDPNSPTRDIKIDLPSGYSKSPSTIRLFIADLSLPSEIRFTIEKFGQIPDPNYFSKPFDPISVTDGDAKQCLVIPSDQFK